MEDSGYCSSRACWLKSRTGFRKYVAPSWGSIRRCSGQARKLKTQPALDSKWHIPIYSASTANLHGQEDHYRKYRARHPKRTADASRVQIHLKRWDQHRSPETPSESAGLTLCLTAEAIGSKKFFQQRHGRALSTALRPQQNQTTLSMHQQLTHSLLSHLPTIHSRYRDNR